MKKIHKTEKPAVKTKEKTHLNDRAHSINQATPRTDQATQPMDHAEEVQQSNDEHIDQDYPGFPHPPARTKTIHNGSAGAFEGTESVRDDGDSDEDDDDRAMGDRKY
jgi:hypothetical protein